MRSTATILATAVVLLGASSPAQAIDQLVPLGFETPEPWAGVQLTPDSTCQMPSGRTPAAHRSGQYAYAVPCWQLTVPPLTIRFTAGPQSYLTLWARYSAQLLSFEEGRFEVQDLDDPANLVTTVAGSDKWTPLTLPIPASPTLRRIGVRAYIWDGEGKSPLAFHIDDLTWSPAPQPDTEIVARPPALTNQRAAEFGFASSISGSSFSCWLDGAQLASCPQGVQVAPPDGEHTFRVAADDDGFGHGDATPASYTWRIDTVAPRTRITSGPAGNRTRRSESLEFSSTDSDVTRFECALDSPAFTTCTSPRRYDGLTLGRHVFRVRAIDAAGNVELAPPSAAWTTEDQPRPGEPTIPTTTVPPMPEPTGESAIEVECAASANPAAPDTDRDGLVDRCDDLPPANLPVIAGVNAHVQVIDGEVFIKLARPRGTARAQAGDQRDDGFVPLKGAAVVPLRSTLDTTKGIVRTATARSVNRNGVAMQPQLARFAAGVFMIEQARRRRAEQRRAAVAQFRLKTPLGTSRPCPRGRTRRVVRSLLGDGSGHFQMIGAASTATVSGRARWAVRDRCDGTLTQVTRGVVVVRDRRSGRRKVLRSGGYLVSAPRFGSLKGRPSR